MADNTLKRSPDVTGEEFLAEIYGSKSGPEWRALTTLFGEILTGRSTLVSDLSLPLREGSGASERKRVQERVSGWPSRYDFVEETGGRLLKNMPDEGLDGLTFAVDFSDIGKVFGGAGMEGMSMGRDGGTGDIRMGHDFICVSLVGAAYPEALPVYVKLGRGRRGHAELLGEAIDATMAHTGGKGWIVGDRGMDDAGHLLAPKREDRNAVVLRDEAGVRAGEGARRPETRSGRTGGVCFGNAGRNRLRALQTRAKEGPLDGRWRGTIPDEGARSEAPHGRPEPGC